jgi:hypothetical protein
MESSEGTDRVIPAKAGIQSFQARMDSCFRRNDTGTADFLRNHQFWIFVGALPFAEEPGGLIEVETKEHRTSNVQHRIVNEGKNGETEI